MGRPGVPTLLCREQGYWSAKVSPGSLLPEQHALGSKEQSRAFAVPQRFLS